jgi:hypothetical protein
VNRQQRRAWAKKKAKELFQGKAASLLDKLAKHNKEEHGHRR